jgi:hypothetical protein
MTSPSVLPRRSAAIALLLLLAFIMLAAAVNVPFALSRMRSRTTIMQVPTAALEAASIPDEWPATTPHDVPWPRADDWSQGAAFGCRVFDVRTTPSSTDSNGFSMDLQLLGWPLPVIEVKQMWWDWDDPKLSGPESDPAPTLRLRGLLLNPLIVGGGAWLILVVPWLAAVIATRSWRRRHHRCMSCGYPIGTSPVCTECGEAVAS